MNIVEKYIEINSSLILFISGMSGCGKTQIGKFISRDFKIKLIDQDDYYIKSHDVKTKLGDKEVINWYTDDAIDWDKFNKDIEKAKTSGVIVIGNTLPDDRMALKPDLHIQLSMSKQECVRRRLLFLEHDKQDINEEFEKLKINKLAYPYYLETVNRSKINKFVNITEKSDDTIYDDIFDIVISFIKVKLKQD